MITFNQIKYSIDQDENCVANIKKERNKEKYQFYYPCHSTTSCKPYSLYLKKGIYKLEVWGAQGGDGRIQNTDTIRIGSGGRGAYASGFITFHKHQHLYLYVGGKGEDQIDTGNHAYGKGGYNGGGDGGSDLNDPDHGESNGGGGGATDFRIIYNESFDDLLSLKSRIITAAGGGSECSSDDTYCINSTDVESDFLCTNTEDYISNDYRGGPGGALHGYRLNSVVFTGNQTSGSFGVGTKGLSIGGYYIGSTKYNGGSIGGGGGGYFGGASLEEKPNIIHYIQAGGAGGSSYVSGCEGCRSVNLFPEDEVVTTKNNVHYSGLQFFDIDMKSGIETFSSPNGESEIGHSGNGHATITIIKLFPDTSFYQTRLSNFILHICPIILLSITKK